MKQNIFNPVQAAYNYSIVQSGHNDGFAAYDFRTHKTTPFVCDGHANGTLRLLKRRIDGTYYCRLLWSDEPNFTDLLQDACNEIIDEHNAKRQQFIFDGLHARIDAQIEAMQHKLSLRVAHFRAVLNAQVIHLHK